MTAQRTQQAAPGHLAHGGALSPYPQRHGHHAAAQRPPRAPEPAPEAMAPVTAQGHQHGPWREYPDAGIRQCGTCLLTEGI